VALARKRRPAICQGTTQQRSGAMVEPTSDEAWQAGFEAGRRRQALVSNPYPVGTEAFRIWQAGWREADGTGREGDVLPSNGSP
jgi:hypothetical protein